MDSVKVLIKKLPGAHDMPLPEYMTDAAAGMDIFAAVEGEVVLNPTERCLIPTGIVISLPEGYEAQIRPRSGLALRHGVTVLNAPGTIDADYRGEVAVILINHGENPFIIKRYDRIAQMVVQKVTTVAWQLEECLPATARGEGGFGHTK